MFLTFDKNRRSITLFYIHPFNFRITFYQIFLKNQRNVQNITILVRNPVQSTFISCIPNAIARTVFIFMSTAPNEVKNRQNNK